MNLADLKQEVLEHEFSESRYSDFVVNQLNRAQLQLADKIDFRALEQQQSITTVAATATSALPTNYMREDSLWNEQASGNNVPLIQLDSTDFRSLPDASGQPTHYLADRTNLRFYPTPNAAYTLSFYYHRSPVEMVDDSDEPEIDSRCDQLMVRYALARCFERENDTGQAQYHWGLYDKEMIYAMGSLNDDADDIGQPRQVEGAWPDSGGSITVVRP